MVKGASSFLLGGSSTTGNRIRAVRKAWGWTQENLAQALQTDRQIVSYWERDKSKPSRAAMRLLAQLFHTSVEALTTGIGFTLPDLPEKQSNGNLESGLAITLPSPVEGRISLVGLDPYRSEVVTLKEAVRCLKAAYEAGHSVWLVLPTSAMKKN